MKALLRTRCGCTQVVDLPHIMSEVVLPLYTPTVSVSPTPMGSQMPPVRPSVRTFRYRDATTVFGVPMLLFTEEQ